MLSPDRPESSGITWQEMLALARQVIQGFEQVEQRPWTVDASMIELTKQVGDLAAHVMVKERYYLADRETDPRYQTDEQVIGDELADILYCLIRIADHYGIDLAHAHLEARRAELRYLSRIADETAGPEAQH